MQTEQQILLKNSHTQHKPKVYENSQYEIYLSREANSKPLYLTFGDENITIGSKSSNQKQDIHIAVDDFIGFNEYKVSDDWLRIKLNAFVKKKKIFKSLKRYLQHYSIYVLNQNLPRLEKLRINLLKAASNLDFKSSTQSPKLMIYFNPNAGSNSKKHFDRTVDFIRHTNFSFDMLQTQRRDHCLEHINTELDFKKYHGIVIISGDGLMHQFVNSKAAGVVPVTHVPGGSGNAFAKYQTVLANQACEDEQAIFLAVKGNMKKMNLMEINLQKIDRPIYSFLSFQWCYMADIDMNSQFLRFLGGLRFQVYGVYRFLFVRRYQGKFTYSLTQTNLPPLDKQIKNQEAFKSQQDVYFHQIMTVIPYVSDRYEISPLLELEDQAMDMQMMKAKEGRFALLKYMLNMDSGSQFDRQKKTKKTGYNFDWAKIKSFRLQPNGDDRGVYGIDGERYQSQNIQAKMSDKKVLTFA